MTKKTHFSGTRILVTGGTGLIGSHLIEELLKINAKIVVPFRHARKKSYLFTRNLDKKVRLEKVDITNKQKLSQLVSNYRIDYIFHLAAQTTVVNAFINPYYTLKNNILGTTHILEAAKEYKHVRGVIVASSDKAYGKTKKAYTEESPLKGDHPYDVSKASGDLISQMYFKTYNLPVVITRFGNVYGEGDLNFDRIIPGICKAIITNKALKIRSDGTYVRDYLYARDVARGYITLLQNIDNICGEAFNFSSQETLSVLEVIKKVEKILGRTIPYTIQNDARNEIPFQHLDDRKIRRLGWKNNYTITSVFKKVLKWYCDIHVQKYKTNF